MLWLVENGNCGGIYFAMSEEDIQRVLKHPVSMIASDGEVVRLDVPTRIRVANGTSCACSVDMCVT